MTDQIDQNKTRAMPAHIANHCAQIGRRKMMAHVHGKGEIGVWQRVTRGIGADNRQTALSRQWRQQINPDHLDSKPAPQVPQNTAVAASHVQDAPDGRGIAPDRRDYQLGIAQKSMDPGKVTISLLHQSGGNIRFFHPLRFKRSLQAASPLTRLYPRPHWFLTDSRVGGGFLTKVTVWRGAEAR